MSEARHPILDKSMKTSRYVSNNLEMEEDKDVLMITGPNMGLSLIHIFYGSIRYEQCINSNHIL